MIVQYPFARNEDGKLIDINSVNKDHRYDHKYYCPGCGQEMRPRLGQHRTKCFYHFNCDACGSESYIHRVGKELLCNYFNDPEKPFYIGFDQRVCCAEWDSCMFRIGKQCPLGGVLTRKVQHNLKEWYDTAEIEKEFTTDKNASFRADIMLSSKSSPNRDPFFLEICYKHQCSEEKKASGLKIMELELMGIEDLVKVANTSIFSEFSKDSSDGNLVVHFYNMEEVYLSDGQRTQYLNNRFPCSPFYHVGI